MAESAVTAAVKEVAEELETPEDSKPEAPKSAPDDAELDKDPKFQYLVRRITEGVAKALADASGSDDDDGDEGETETPRRRRRTTKPKVEEKPKSFLDKVLSW